MHKIQAVSVLALWKKTAEILYNQFVRRSESPKIDMKLVLQNKSYMLSTSNIYLCKMVTFGAASGTILGTSVWNSFLKCQGTIFCIISWFRGMLDILCASCKTSASNLKVHWTQWNIKSKQMGETKIKALNKITLHGHNDVSFRKKVRDYQILHNWTTYEK